MAQAVQLPDGSWFPLKEGESPADAMSAASKLYPDAFGIKEAPKPAKKSGVSGALGLGLESLISSGRTAFGALSDPEQAAQAALTRQQALQQKYEEPASWERVKQAYEQSGLLSAAGEAVSQIPKAIAEQAPQIGATLGGARAGAGLGSFFGPVGTVVGGVAGAAVPSLIQQFGGNIERQAAEGKPIERAPALAAAVPQAALDVAGTLIPFGGKLVSQLTGIPEKALLIGNRNAQKLAEERLAATLAKGTAVGAAAEIPTEIAQQMLERAQAGLSLTSQDALAEYGQTAYQVGLLAPIGAAGRVSERAGARRELAEEEKRKAAEARTAAMQAEKDRAAAEQARYTQMEAELGGGQEAVTAPYYESRQAELPGFGGAVPRPEPTAAPEFVDYKKQMRDLEARLNDLRTQAQQTTDLAQKQALNAQYQKTQTAIQEAERLDREQKKALATPENKIESLRKRMAAAEESGDVPAQGQIAAQLQALGVKDMAETATPEQLGIPLAEHRPVSEGKAAFAARVYKPGAQTVEEQEQEYLAEQERQRQQVTEEAARTQRLLPETLALKRISERPAAALGFTEGVQRQGQISGLVDQLVGNFMQQAGVTPTGQVVSGVGTERVSRADSLRAQLAYANATDNRPRAKDLRDMLAEMDEPETERAAGDLDFAMRAKKAGIEGKQSPGVMEANRVTRLAQSQLTAFDRLADYVQSVRESDQNVAESRKQTLRAAAERMKDITAGLALNEMDARRMQAGMASLSTEEKTRAVGRMNAILNELITRGAGLFNVVETPAITRGTLTLQSAKEGPPPLGQRMFGNLGMAANSLRGQLRQVMDDTVGIKAPAPRAPVVPRRADEGLRVQFAGQERPIAQQFEAAKTRATEDQRTTLDELETKFKNLSPEAQELALEQARNVELGKEMTVPGQLQQELADLRRAGESETGQAELFPGASEKGVTRTTTNRFMRYLDSGDVYKFKAALAEQARMAEFQAKRAATIQRKLDAEIEQQQKVISKLTAPWFESPVNAARKAFEKAVDKNKAAVDLAAEIRKKRTAQRQAVGAKVADLLTAANEAKKHLNEIKDVHDFYAKEYLAKPMVAKYKNGFEIVTQQLEAAEKSVAAAEKSLEKGRAAQQRVLDRQASDTINNAILREGQKAEGAIERARLAVVKAQGEESVAAARLRRLQDQAPARVREETAAEVIAKLPVTDVTKVYRDTSDTKVQERVADQKKNVAQWEAAYEEAQRAGDERAMEMAVKNIENAYNKIYEEYANAPVKRDVSMTNAQLRAQEVYERAQYGTVEALTKLFEEKTGAKLRMTKRKVEGVIKSTRTGAVQTAIKEPSVAQQEAQFKKEQATGEYAAKTLEDLAKVRAQLKEVKDRIAYIDANKAEKGEMVTRRRQVGKDKWESYQIPAVQAQKVARSQAVAERTRLEGEERRLEAMQKDVEREAKVEKQATKMLRTEKQRMLRSAGRLQEAIGEEGFPAPVRETTATPLSEESYKQLLDGSVVRAINDIAANSEVPLLRESANKVKDFILRTKFEFVPEIIHEGQKVPALYVPSRNTILMAPEGRTQEDLVHEAVHAASMRVLEMPAADLTPMQRQAKAELTAMYNAAKKDKRFEGQHGIRNVKEFVSEAQSNQEFRDLLDEKPGLLQRIFNAILRAIGFGPTELSSAKAQEAIEKIYLQSRVIEEAAPAPSGRAVDTPVLDDLASAVIQQPKTLREKLGTNPMLEAEMQGVDMRAGLREALKAGDDKLFEQAMYHVLKADQKMPQVFAVLNNGPLETYTDEVGLHGVRSSGKNSGRAVFDAISDIPAETPQKKVDLATMYMVAQRALNKGVQTLDFGGLGVTEEKLRAAMKEVDANPELKAALDHVRDTYNKYNEGLIKFAVQAGRITKAQAEELTKTGDYVPFYRVRDNGTAELVYGDDLVVNVGDIKNQPYLHELKGGENKILPLNESLFRNTLLLTDASLSNMARKSVAYALQDIGKGAGEGGANKMAIHSGFGPDDANVFRFYSEPSPNNPDDDGRRWIKVDTKGTVAEGVPAALVIKSMEGAHLPLPAFLKMAGAFSDVLRSGVTRMPPYILRQLIRDPMAASFTGGLNYGPLRAMVKAGKEFVGQYRGTSTAAPKLIEKGLIQSGIFAGDVDDMSKMALQLASGKDASALDKVFAAMDRMAIKADASTRALVYENALKNGLSEVQADAMTMESMNFYKRGLNPAVQYGNRLIPFLNSQIQGLNVLYKAATGRMPYEEQQKIKQKFYNNAVFLMGLGFVYAMAMDDDEYFKNARPRDKYTNFFLHLPGVDEPVKIPTPFEAGYFFSVAVALVDALKSDNYTPEQWQAVRDMFLNSIPGWSSRGVPQMVKPVFEVFTNKNFLSGAPIETMRQQSLDITERYNANTTEFAKRFSKALPILSPVQIEHLTRAYLGVAPLVAFSAANQLFAPESKGVAPEMRASETPFFGSMFQKKYGGADADSMYRMAKEAEESRNTFNRMRKEGRTEAAKEFMEDHRAEIASATVAGQYRQLIGRINLDMERARNRKDMTPAQLRARLDDLDKAKQDAADKFMQRFYSIESRVGRTTPQ